MTTLALLTLLCLLGLIVMAVVIFFSSAFKKVPDNEKWVVTRLGKTTVKDPGRVIQIPLIDQVIKVDIGEEPTKVQDQTCITKDMVPVIIHMIIYSRAVDPIKYSSLANRRREDFVHLSSSTLKEIVSARTLDEVLSARDSLGSAICDKLNKEIDPNLGMRIEKVKIMEIVVSKEVLAAMAATGEFPSECPACGAPVNGQVAKGTRQIKCEYCGYSIKL
jgi:regulator of protease activity HflC (stomatin/prohibitin superfamily)